jgi:hypothetical protein
MLLIFINDFLRPGMLRSVLCLSLLLSMGRSEECRADDSAPRQIFICTSPNLPPTLRKSVDAFMSQADQVPLLKALIDGKEASGIVAQTSEDLMVDKAYNTAAHNHLVVIGLRTLDPLLDKVWGYDATITEKGKSVYSQGYGYMQGDIGWVESDRNPFLHSRRIKSAPEDTIVVKITGTSEAGVLAALHAFQGGMLNGFVPAGPLSRPKTTLLDLDPSPDPAPKTLPAQIQIGSDTAALVGWNQIPEDEYRAVLEAGGVEPKKMWRYKYLVPGMLEKPAIIRWLGGVNRMGFGNAIDVIECGSAAEASTAAEKMSESRYKGLSFTPITLSTPQPAWECPQAPDEVMDSTWKIIVTSSGNYLFLSSLPHDGTSAVIQAVVAQ